MINVEPPNKYMFCNCCHSEKELKKITFCGENVDSVVHLCVDCQKELMKKLREDKE